jgi:hypothetical protein
MNLIVRVKRRRDQEPSDSIWIMDDTEAPSRKKLSTRKITESLGALSTSTNQAEPRSTKLYMSRVQTVEVGGEADLDKSALSASLSRVQKREREDNDQQNVRMEDQIQNEPSLEDKIQMLQSGTDPERVTKDSSSMWITNGKKVLRSSYTLEKFVVVDVSQIPYSRPSLVISSSIPEGSNSSISGVKKSEINNPVKKSLIIDPATRKLDVAIDKAIKLNDFNEMVQALQIGANINYQRRSDGMTALMAAAMQKNSRMVSRLIAKDADVFLLDTSGKTAMDHGKKDHNKSHTGNSHVQNASVEITLLLHKTAVKAQQLANKRQQRSDEEEEAMKLSQGPEAEGEGSTVTISTSLLPSDSGIESSRVTDITDVPDGEEIGIEERKKQIAEENDDYVVDLYMRSDGLTGEKGSGSVESGENFHAPIVQIDGLHINQSGDVELIFQYDSDWSDLADDEEPDSNDERFEGNDYPEEGEEGEGVDDEDTDDEDKYVALRADIEDGEGAGSGYGRRNNKPGDGDEDVMEGLDYGFTGGNGSSRRVERFNRNSVGRVLRPHMMDDEGDGGVMSQQRDPEALQQLWGLREGGGDDDYEEDEEDDNNAVNNKFRSERAEHNQRVKGMRAGTGMQFAANPREFDRSGLPKYGAELSDEEGDIELYEDILMDENKPSTVTFAPSLKASNIIHSRPHTQEIDVERSADYDDMDTGVSTGSGSRGGKMNHLDMIRKEVRETAAARTKGDLTGDLNNYRLSHTIYILLYIHVHTMLCAYEYIIQYISTIFCYF